MGYNIGPTVAVKGEKEYSNALNTIKTNMKLVASEAAVMTSQFGKNNTSVAALKAKSDVLNKAMAEQKKAVSEAERALKRMDAEGVKPTDRAYVQMKTNLNNARAAMETTKREILANEEALKSAAKQTQRFGDGWKNFASGAGKVAAGALKTIAAAAAAVVVAAIGAVKAFGDGVKSVAEFGDTVDKNSQRLGLSREAYQEWEFVLSQSGVDINTMQVGLKTLTNTIDDARKGVTGAVDKFTRLGISMDDVNTLSREELFKETIKGLQNMTDEVEKAALANDMFGRSGQEIMPLLNQTAESTDALLKKAQDYGFVMSEEAVNASVNFVDSLDLLSHTATGLKNRLIGEFLPSITEVTDGLALLFAGDVSGLDQIQSGIKDFIDELSDVMPEVSRVGGEIIQQIIRSMLENLPAFINEALPNMIGFISEMISMLLGTIVTIFPTAVPAIVEAATNVIESILTTIQQNADMISSTVVQVLLMFVQFITQNLSLLIRTGLDIVISIANGLLENIPVLIPAIIEMITEIALALTDPDTLTQLVVAAFQIVFEFAKALVEAIPQLLEAVAQIVVNLVTAFAQAAPQLWENGKEFILQLTEGIAAQFADLFLLVGPFVNDNIIQPVKDKVSGFFNVGRDLIVGIWNGIGDKIAWLKSKIRGLVDTIKGWFTGKEGFDENSPSKWGIMIGYELPEGIGIGINKGTNEALAAASNVINKVKSTMSGTGVNVDVNGGGTATQGVGAAGPQFIFHVYAKDKETAVEAADATLAAFARSRWAVST